MKGAVFLSKFVIAPCIGFAQTTIFFIISTKSQTVSLWKWGKTQEGSTEAEIPTAAEVEAESVSLDRQTLFLVADETKTLTATVYPEDASDKTVNWVSSNPETASVDENGVVTGISEGETAVFAITADGGKTAKCAVTVEPSISGHGYADLGLSVKWATRNVGADSPEESGDFFAWGEIATKDDYTEDNSLTYGNKEIQDISGNPEYDAARANWGGTWRLPTMEECEEFLDNCQFEWTQFNGQNGFKVTGPSGNSIFLPAAGKTSSGILWHDDEDATFWSSTTYSSISAYGPYIQQDKYNYISIQSRSYGLPLRAVSD